MKSKVMPKVSGIGRWTASSRQPLRAGRPWPACGRVTDLAPIVPARNRSGIQHPTSNIQRPTSNIQRPTSGNRRGVSLMEVLIALFILSIGLLGVAALIPIGRYSVAEATKSDRCAACGHAALDEIKTRGLVDANIWAYNTGPLTSGATFAIDPLYTGGSNYLGAITRLHYTNNAAAGPIFIGNDDLLFDIPDDSSLRPRGLQLDGSVGAPTSEGRYTWLFTASPSPTEDAAASSDWRNRKTFTVSAVVCFQRDLTGGEDKPFTPTTWTPSGKFMQVGADLGIQRDDWILVCGSRGVPVGVWYRVVSAGGYGGTSYLTLQGPDWQYGDTVTAVYMPSVVGVYTGTVRLP